MKTIDREFLKRKIDSGVKFHLIETLPAEMYREAHIPGAVNLPPDRVKQIAPQLVPDKNAEIVVYCARFT